MLVVIAGSQYFPSILLANRKVTQYQGRNVMEGLIKFSDKYYTKNVVENEKVLTVSARLIDDDSWELSIIGKNSQACTWTDWYASPQEAISAGLSAILDEGVDQFYANPDFSYIDDL